MISVEMTQRFRKRVAGAHREAEVSAVLREIIAGFGKPHAHSGLSIQKLGRHVFECRTDLDWRLVFEARKGVLTFDFAGNHDEVQAYLRGRR
jgi:mRNA-degrading endonuclease YafQ of YafQ-DinJ toxin-antitoxin module